MSNLIATTTQGAAAPLHAPELQAAEEQAALLADVLAEKISALDVTCDDGLLPAMIAQAFPINPGSFYTLTLLMSCWDTVMDFAESSMPKQKRLRKVVTLLEAVRNHHSSLLAKITADHSSRLHEAEMNLVKITANRDHLEGQSKQLEEQCKRWEEQCKQWELQCQQLRKDLVWHRSTLDKCRMSVEHWKNLYQDNKSVLSAQGNPVSRAIAWENDEVIHAKEINWVAHAKLTRSQQNEAQVGIATLLQKTEKMTTEDELYKPISTFLNNLNIFRNRVKILNTSQTKYLARQAPDFSICIPRVTKPHAALIHGIIEVKKRGEDVDVAKHLGQLKDYMLNLMSSQCEKGRMSFWGFLTNMSTNILVEITEHRHNGCSIRRITQYPPMEWVEMIQYIHSTCQREGWIPPKLHFRDSLGPLLELIACNSKWQLGEFKTLQGALLHSTKAQCMVVKVSVGIQAEKSHKHELDVLRHFRKLGNQPTSIIKLVWDPAADGPSRHPESRIEFGLSPRGRPFSLAILRKRSDADTMFAEIIDSIFWLHSTARIIHRDIRRDNIIIHEGHPIIIDFDCSYKLNARDQAKITTYAGGLICVPKRVVKRAINEIDAGGDGQVQSMSYTPKKKDDLFAFVILVISMIFPSQFDKFPVERISWRRVGLEQLHGMIKFFEECKRSTGWGKWWALAKNCDYEGLKSIGEQYQFPSL
ncbi:hypothetical protein BGX38DRAFT_1263415 [Terfezia claveryi]|nr:hypothetical protein BGX38DRAFT_1263415 [Terfezia claveryi]